MCIAWLSREDHQDSDKGWAPRACAGTAAWAEPPAASARGSSRVAPTRLVTLPERVKAQVCGTCSQPADRQLLPRRSPTCPPTSTHQGSKARCAETSLSSPPPKPPLWQSQQAATSENRSPGSSSVVAVLPSAEMFRCLWEGGDFCTVFHFVTTATLQMKWITRQQRVPCQSTCSCVLIHLKHDKLHLHPEATSKLQHTLKQAERSL